MALFALFVLLQMIKTEKLSCRSSVISMRSCPPQYTLLYPRKPISLALFFLFFVLFFSFPPFLSFSSFIPPRFLSSCLFFSCFLSFLTPLFFGFSYFFFPFFSCLPTLFFFFFCVCACVCVSRVYVHAYLAIACVSADDNVKHIKSNIRYDNKINKMKHMWNI